MPLKELYAQKLERLNKDYVLYALDHVGMWFRGPIINAMQSEVSMLENAKRLKEESRISESTLR